MAMSTGGRHQATINVTPMIDVLLVLLIIFMVVVNTESLGFDAQVPQPSTNSAPVDLQDIILTVHEDRTVSFNQELVQDADLEQRFTQIFRTRGNHVIFIGAHPDLDFEHVLHVLDIARGVGLDRVALLPKNQPSNL